MIFARSVYRPIVVVLPIYMEDVEEAAQRDGLTLVEKRSLVSWPVGYRRDHGG
jgi:hypothetical protein